MNRTITISGDALSLVLLLPERGMPEIVAFGSGADGAQRVAHRAGRVNGMDVSVPSAVLLPTGGMGFFGWPAIAGHRDGRHFTLEFSNWQHAAGSGAHTLRARDDVAMISLAISLEISGATLVSAATLLNEGASPYLLDRCMAGSMVIGGGEVTLTAFNGMWGQEFHQATETLGHGIWLQENRRGRTSYDRTPGAILDTDGESLAFHLGWSGNHVIAIDRLDDGRRLVHAGELFEPGEMRLGPRQSYQTPSLFIARDPAHLRDSLRARMSWPGGAMRPRPVTLNTWEGNYFDHRLESLKAQADAAADLGVERFVLDDGWFGRRDDDTMGLGDWRIDERKYPHGLQPLIDHVVSRGMEFGIWFEPEMVSPRSDLFRAHHDWILQVEGRPLLTSRKQLALDLTRPEVHDHLFGCIDALLAHHAVACIKWDMNRDLTHAGDSEGRAAIARQTRAVYALIDRIRTAHPGVEVETCASGGGRADYGMLERAHRIWISDCTDAVERLEIQRGARVFFPPEILGAHVSASPNHQTRRRLPLSFRAIVAIAYHFGVELDPLKLEPAERAELKEWIALHKRLRPILHGGRQFHLKPQDGRYVWGAFAGGRGAVIVAQAAPMRREQPAPLRLPADVVPAGRWRVASCAPAPDFIRISADQQALLAGEIDFSSQTLVHAGLPLPALRPEAGVVLELERIEGA